jgi:hypothetical protein
MRSTTLALTLASALGLCIGPAAASAHLEELDRATAFDEISKTEGIVFVDLFAPW